MNRDREDNSYCEKHDEIRIVRLAIRDSNFQRLISIPEIARMICTGTWYGDRVVANELSNAQESVFALYCLNWLHKHRSFSLRHGFQCGKDVSANADISIRFKGLIDGKYEGKAELDTLFSQARQCGKGYIRRNGMSYHGLEGLSFAFCEYFQLLKELDKSERVELVEISDPCQSFVDEFLQNKV